MNARAEDVKTLIDLGISGTQAKILFALVEIGISSIKEISEFSGVARPDTYRAVLGLEHEGLVEKIISTPTRYKSLPLSDILSILIGQREKKSLELQDRSKNILKQYEKKLATQKTTSKSGQFALVSKGGALSKRIEKLAKNCQKSIYVMAPQRVLTRFFPRYFEILGKKSKEKVSIKIVTEQHKGDVLSSMLGQKGAHLETRHTAFFPPVSFAIFDETEILLSELLQTGNENTATVWSNNASLVELAQSYFNTAWFSAVEPLSRAFKRDRRQFDYLFANMAHGFSYNKMIFDDDGRPIDFVILEMNRAFEEITRIERNDLGKRVTRTLPDAGKDVAELINVHGEAVAAGKSIMFEHYFAPINKWFSVHLYSPEKGYFVILCEDITEHKKTEIALKEYEERLRILKSKLQQLPMKSIAKVSNSKAGNESCSFAKPSGK